MITYCIIILKVLYVQSGAYDILRLLREELHLAITFTGCSKVADITPDYLRHASYYIICKHHKFTGNNILKSYVSVIFSGVSSQYT